MEGSPAAGAPEAGWIERDELARLAVGGAEAGEFLHRITSNDLAGLGEGEGRPTLLLERTGRIVDRLLACRLGARFLLLGGPGRAAPVRTALERHVFADDVRVEDLAARTRLVCVLGPEAAPRLSRALGAGLEELPRFHGRAVRLASGEAFVVRADDVAGRCFRIVVAASAAAELAERLADLPEVGEAAFHAERIAAGVPEFGREFDEGTMALEAGLGEAISFTKGCYVGQEVVARVHSRGRVKRTLVRVRLEGGEVPAPGAELAAGERAAGEIRSATARGGAVLAIASVDSASAAPGTRLLLRGGVRPREAVVLPSAAEAAAP